MLCYWLSFNVNRLERTHFVVLAELSPKKPALTSIHFSFNAIQSRNRSSELAIAVKVSGRACTSSISIILTHFLYTFNAEIWLLKGQLAQTRMIPALEHKLDVGHYWVVN